MIKSYDLSVNHTLTNSSCLLQLIGNLMVLNWILNLKLIITVSHGFALCVRGI